MFQSFLRLWNGNRSSTEEAMKRGCCHCRVDAVVRRSGIACRRRRLVIILEASFGLLLSGFSAGVGTSLLTSGRE